MKRSIVIRVLAITVLISVLVLLSLTDVDFVYTGF